MLWPAATVSVGLSKVTDVEVAVSMANMTTSELPPPGAGFDTPIVAVPEAARSDAAMEALSTLALSNEVGLGAPLNVTTAPFTNPKPCRVSVNAPEFCFSANGASDVIPGMGLPTTMAAGADWAPWKNLLPEYDATIVWAPEARESTDNWATPPFTGTTPNMTLPSEKMTCPVRRSRSTTGSGLTLAFSRTGVPDAALDGAVSVI